MLGLADVVLAKLEENGELPADVRGVWTGEDDRALESADARDVQRVLKKHGQEGFEGRWRFLRNWRGEGG